jgi:hypothetical protein
VLPLTEVTAKIAKLLKEWASACCVEVFTKLEFSEHRVAASISGFILRIFAIALDRQG